MRSLSELCGFEDVEGFQKAHCQSIEEALGSELSLRAVRWSEAIAVGSLVFVEKVKNDLGVKAMHRKVLETDETYALREPAEAYAEKFTGKIEALRTQNTILWDETVDDVRT
jgi:hypothetical protein